MKKLHPFSIEFSQVLIKKIKDKNMFDTDHFTSLSYKYCSLKPEEQIQVSRELSKNQKVSVALITMIKHLSNNHISLDQKYKIIAVAHISLEGTNLTENHHSNSAIEDILWHFLIDFS